MTAAPTPRTHHALFVGAGILASRLVGFVRQRTMNHYFGGRSDAADAFYAAFKIPNLLQNLFGEGALSGSFIPVYSRLLAEGKTEEAQATARAVLGILTLAISILVALGVTTTPAIISLIAPGFVGEKKALTITLVRILFPGSGILVVSAWCLGVLNSHRRFFLSYSAPVIWNLSIIGAIVFGPGRSATDLAIAAAWGAVCGSLAQILIQLPSVKTFIPSLRPTLTITSSSVRTVFKHFIPTTAVRGVAQISAYIDQMIASLLPTGAITGLTNAQLIYTLPVSLFGMSIAASELPELSRLSPNATNALEQRLRAGCRHLAFFIIPTISAFLILGDTIVGAVYQTGAFSAQDVRYVWAILCGSSIGLLAGTQARLFSSALYALHDPRTPLRFASIRVVLSGILGVSLATWGTSFTGLPPLWGAVGLSAASGCAGWIEFFLLKNHLIRARAINPKVEKRFITLLALTSVLSAAICYPLKNYLIVLHPALAAGIILPLYGGLYAGTTVACKIPEAIAHFSKIKRALARIVGTLFRRRST